MAGEKIPKIETTTFGTDFHLKVSSFLTTELELQVDKLPNSTDDELFFDIVEKLKLKYTNMQNTPNVMFLNLFEELKKQKQK